MNERWRARRGLATLVHAVLLSLPLLAALAGWRLTAWAVRSGGLLAASDPSARRWWAILGGAIAAGLIGWSTVHLLPRLLPLTTLLRMSLIFPDDAPSRLAVALRAGSTRNLDELVADVRGTDESDARRDAAARILALAAALSGHDRITRGHSERVRALSELIGESLGLSRDDLDRLRWAALLHDLGKLHVHPDILTKPEELGPEEWAAVRQHPVEGAKLVQPLHAFLGGWATTVRYHHERWDGSGYPEGVRGETIPLGARIVGVADAFEVMTSSARVYRATVTSAEAREELVACSGTHFDPAIVRTFLTLSDHQVRRAMGRWFWIAQLIAAPLGARSIGQSVGRATGTDPALTAPSPELHPDATLHPDAAVHEGAATHEHADGGQADLADTAQGGLFPDD